MMIERSKYLLLKTGTLLVLFGLSLPLASEGRTSAEEFRRKMLIHKSHIIRLATATMTAFPEHFKGIPMDLAISYLQLHDQPKIQDLATLKKYGYKNRHTLNQRLALLYQKKFGEGTADEQAEMSDVKNSLNGIEGLEKQEFFKSKGLDPNSEMIKSLLWLEKIVDVTDTGIYRRVEMHIPEDKKYDGANFLEKSGDSKGAVVSRWIEDNCNTLLKPPVSVGSCNSVYQ